MGIGDLIGDLDILAIVGVSWSYDWSWSAITGTGGGNVVRQLCILTWNGLPSKIFIFWIASCHGDVESNKKILNDAILLRISFEKINVIVVGSTLKWNEIWRWDGGDMCEGSVDCWWCRWGKQRMEDVNGSDVEGASTIWGLGILNCSKVK